MKQNLTYLITLKLYSSTFLSLLCWLLVISWTLHVGVPQAWPQTTFLLSSSLAPRQRPLPLVSGFKTHPHAVDSQGPFLWAPPSCIQQLWGDTSNITRLTGNCWVFLPNLLSPLSPRHCKSSIQPSSCSGQKTPENKTGVIWAPLSHPTWDPSVTSVHSTFKIYPNLIISHNSFVNTLVQATFMSNLDCCNAS